MTDWIVLLLCGAAVAWRLWRLRTVTLPPLLRWDRVRMGHLYRAMVLIRPGCQIGWPSRCWLAHDHAVLDRRGCWVSVRAEWLPCRMTREGESMPQLDPYQGWRDVSDTMPTRPDQLCGDPIWDYRPVPLARLGVVGRDYAGPPPFHVVDLTGLYPVQSRGMLKFYA